MAAKPVNRLLVGDAESQLKSLPAGFVQTCVTSVPYYGLRDYGCDGQIGLEKTPRQYVDRLVAVFDQVGRVMRDDGTLWLNVGDTYWSNPSKGVNVKQSGRGVRTDYGHVAPHRSGKVDGLKPKDAIGIPWMLAFALRDAGWYLRQEIIWQKPNAMTESCKDRCARDHEQLFLFSKMPRYYFDQYALRKFVSAEQSNVPRSVWSINTKPSKEAHFAVMPQELVRRCVLSGSSDSGQCPLCGELCCRKLEYKRVATRPGKDTKVAGKSGKQIGNRDPERHVTRVKCLGWERGCDCETDLRPCVVLDPFMGSGTTAVVARKLGRRWLGCELNPEYARISERLIGRAKGGLGIF